MKPKRRVIFIAIVAAVIAFFGYFVLVPTPFAQPPGPPMGPRGMPGRPGRMGVEGGALQWTESEMHEELQMTYSEFLRKEGLMPVGIPRDFLRDKKGKPRKYSRTGWQQLHNLYKEARAPEELRALIGSHGGRLLREIQTQLAVERKELAAINNLYQAALGGFWFEINYPTYTPSAVSSYNVIISIDVLMHVKDSLQRSYGEKTYKSLKKFDNAGENRYPFSFITHQGGYWHPYTFQLSPQAVAQWGSLWAQNQVRLRLLDANNKILASQIQPAGHSANTPTQIIYPPEVRLTPEHEYLSAAQRTNFSGGKFRADYAKGWQYTFSLPLRLEQLARLDKAEAQFIGADGEVYSSTSVRGTRRGPYAGQLPMAAAAPTAAVPGVRPGVPAAGPEVGRPGMPPARARPGAPPIPPGARRVPPGAQLPPLPPPMPGMR